MEGGLREEEQVHLMDDEVCQREVLLLHAVKGLECGVWGLGSLLKTTAGGHVPPATWRGEGEEEREIEYARERGDQAQTVVAVEGT